jgi:hypothetical protein
LVRRGEGRLDQRVCVAAGCAGAAIRPRLFQALAVCSAGFFFYFDSFLKKYKNVLSPETYF